MLLAFTCLCLLTQPKVFLGSFFPGFSVPARNHVSACSFL